MTITEPNTTQVTDSWDSYWHGTAGAGAYSSGGVDHPAVQVFWQQFFADSKPLNSQPKIIDLASGNGAVVDCILAAYEEPLPGLTCLDVSAAAVANIQKRFPDIEGIVSDARSIPLESGSFDIVTSQFGVEYAGLDAVTEAARLLATGGKLAFLLHHQQGSIYQECNDSLNAIRLLQSSRFIPLAIDMFRAGFEAVRGADRSAYEAAATQLAPAIKTLEENREILEKLVAALMENEVVDKEQLEEIMGPRKSLDEVTDAEPSGDKTE